MRRNSNKKGFTIVELVIVIAVIAILAGVMIPTFSNLVEKANESAELQKLSAAYREAYALAIADNGTVDADETVTASGITFKFGANATTCTITDGAPEGYTCTFNNDAWTVEKN